MPLFRLFPQLFEDFDHLRFALDLLPLPLRPSDVLLSAPLDCSLSRINLPDYTVATETAFKFFQLLAQSEEKGFHVQWQAFKRSKCESKSTKGTPDITWPIASSNFDTPLSISCTCQWLWQCAKPHLKDAVPMRSNGDPKKGPVDTAWRPPAPTTGAGNLESGSNAKYQNVSMQTSSSHQPYGTYLNMNEYERIWSVAKFTKTELEVKQNKQALPVESALHILGRSA